MDAGSEQSCGLKEQPDTTSSATSGMNTVVVIPDGSMPDDNIAAAAGGASSGAAAAATTTTTVDITSKGNHQYHTLSPARDKMSDGKEPSSSSLIDPKATFLTGLAPGLE